MKRINTRMRAMTAPGKYIQGPGELDRLVQYTARFGDKVLAIVGGTFYTTMVEKLTAQYAHSGITITRFNSKKKQASVSEISHLVKKYRDGRLDVVVGIGSGKVIDVAKGVSHDVGARLVIVPTSVASDAPTSALSVLYHDDGTHSHEVFYPTNPDIVLVDTNLVVQAPPRLLAAGMGDALATYIEVRACMQANAPNFVEGGCNRTLTGIAIAKLTYDVILKEGRKAMMAAKDGLCTKAFEDVVEVNTLMSGLGFENNGSTGAHGFQIGFSTLPLCKTALHGELVAFGILCQMMLENSSMQEMETITSFLVDVGLPVTLSDIGIRDNIKENIRSVAASMAGGYHMECEPFMVTQDMIFDAILAADRLGNAISKYVSNQELV